MDRLSFLLVFIVTLSLHWVAQAKTLIISDIDDTIKVSHILSVTAKLARASDVSTPFAGMAQLYRLIQNQDPLNTRIVYLSNAPESIAGIPLLEVSHKTFLSLNSFPAGDVELREDIFDQNHKINSIRRLIEQEQPDILIMFGDNGERDAEIYHRAFTEYSSRVRMISFIHQLYSSEKPLLTPQFLAQTGKPIFSEQIGYVTPVEVALELKNQNIISSNAYNWMIQNVSPYIVAEKFIKLDNLKPVSFPFFMNCRDFVWRWSKTPEIRPIYNKIMSECR